jgi:hypothetical protein
VTSRRKVVPRRSGQQRRDGALKRDYPVPVGGIMMGGFDRKLHNRAMHSDRAALRLVGGPSRQRRNA